MRLGLVAYAILTLEVVEKNYGNLSARLIPGNVFVTFSRNKAREARKKAQQSMSEMDHSRTTQNPISVRFTPKSGHWDSAARCPLCAKSGHSAYGPAHTMSSARLVSVAMAAASNERALHRNKQPAKSVGAADIQALIGYDRVGVGRCSGRGASL